MCITEANAMNAHSVRSFALRGGAPSDLGRLPRRLVTAPALQVPAKFTKDDWRHKAKPIQPGQGGKDV